jgi:hypothetical protein
VIPCGPSCTGWAVSPNQSDAWKAVVDEVTDRPEDVDEALRPTGYTLETSFLWFRLSKFTPVEAGWVLTNLELFDQRRPLIKVPSVIRLHPCTWPFVRKARYEGGTSKGRVDPCADPHH